MYVVNTCFPITKRCFLHPLLSAQNNPPPPSILDVSKPPLPSHSPRPHLLHLASCNDIFINFYKPLRSHSHGGPPSQLKKNNMTTVYANCKTTQPFMSNWSHQTPWKHEHVSPTRGPVELTTGASFSLGARIPCPSVSRVSTFLYIYWINIVIITVSCLFYIRNYCVFNYKK